MELELTGGSGWGSTRKEVLGEAWYSEEQSQCMGKTGFKRLLTIDGQSAAGLQFLEAPAGRCQARIAWKLMGWIRAAPWAHRCGCHSPCSQCLSWLGSLAEGYGTCLPMWIGIPLEACWVQVSFPPELLLDHYGLLQFPLALVWQHPSLLGQWLYERSCCFPHPGWATRGT